MIIIEIAAALYVAGVLWRLLGWWAFLPPAAPRAAKAPKPKSNHWLVRLFRWMNEV